MTTCGVVHTGRVDSTGRAEIGSIKCGRVETDHIQSTGTFHIGGLQNLVKWGAAVNDGMHAIMDGAALYHDLRHL